VMQINKGEGVFVKLEGCDVSLATWLVMMRRREWKCLGNDIWKRIK